MDKIKTLRRYGLFDAKVPRYTSFPPANRFEPDTGRKCQAAWLEMLPQDVPVSIYVHIPFCRRLCWFCACRTQGTRTLGPVEAYLERIALEIAEVARRTPDGLRMARLHLGGGTPTLLSAKQMDLLLSRIFAAFAPSRDFEFSVEIDPTDASDAVLEVLSAWNMRRASIGVQDFALPVQEAIGRLQSYDQTQAVIDRLRYGGVKSLNIDLLYGLPHQTAQSLMSTLDLVGDLKPDRLALYGYAHVPHMSKRQVMIPNAALPGAETRYNASVLASQRLQSFGYLPLGIDHFALPDDSLARAAASGTMRRNFQGYTDDPCTTLLGFGASAISRFKDGYIQNAVATAAYQQRAEDTGLTGHKGYAMSPTDHLVADVIDQIMCRGGIDFTDLAVRHKTQRSALVSCQMDLCKTYPDVIETDLGRARIKEGYTEMSRLIAAHLDNGFRKTDVHSLAI